MSTAPAVAAALRVSAEHCWPPGDCEDSPVVFDFFLVISTATWNSRSASSHQVESCVCGGQMGGEYHMKFKLARCNLAPIGCSRTSSIFRSTPIVLASITTCAAEFNGPISIASQSTSEVVVLMQVQSVPRYNLAAPAGFAPSIVRPSRRTCLFPPTTFILLLLLSARPVRLSISTRSPHGDLMRGLP